jgi:hypothetical protein
LEREWGAEREANLFIYIGRGSLLGTLFTDTVL